VLGRVGAADQCQKNVFAFELDDNALLLAMGVVWICRQYLSLRP
jgi:hypothetical protein